MVGIGVKKATLLGLAALLIVGLSAATPASASHGDDGDDIDTAASANADGSVSCNPDAFYTEVICDASADWDGSVDCTGYCKAKFVYDGTYAIFQVGEVPGSQEAHGSDSCGYSLNGCSISDSHDFDSIESNAEGCYTGTIDVYTDVKAKGQLAGHDRASDDYHDSNTGCT